MTVIVCGGRDYLNRGHVFATLDRLHGERSISRVVTGGADGADTLGGKWAIHNGIHVSIYDADWATHGKAAGPIRNQRMLDKEHPELVVAFYGGKGTRDMIQRAESAGVEVLRAG